MQELYVYGIWGVLSSLLFTIYKYVDSFGTYFTIYLKKKKKKREKDKYYVA